MSENVIKLMPKLLSFQHKCKQTKCKQMSEEFETMKQFIVYSNQLNVSYLSRIKDVDQCFGDNQRAFLRGKQKLVKTVESEIEKIDETLHSIINCDNNETDLKEKSSKIRCHLCRKHLPTNLLTTHLTKHLDNSFVRKSANDNKSDLTIECQTTEQLNGTVLEPFCSLVVKDEPNSTSGDNRSEVSAGFDGMANDFTNSEDEDLKSIKRRSKKVTEKVTKRRSKQKQKSNSRKRSLKVIAKDVIICEECGKTCRGSRHLAHHMSRVHKISKKNSNNCHLCDFGNVTIEELKTHFTAEHNLTVNKWNFHCTWPECGQVFRFKTALDKHVRTHTGDLMYKCEWPGCTIQFNKQWKIVEHLRTHTGEKPFTCSWPGCDRAFGNRASYRGHILSHNKSKHVCYFPACDKSYAFKSSLEEHVLNTHRKDERSFICTAEGCGRAFATKQNLRLHKVIHDERPRYTCTHEGCDRSFIEDKSLRKHLDKPHGRVRRLPNGRQLYRDYKCDWPGCEFEANISTNLKIHKMRAHTGEKPEKCQYPGCNFAAVRKFELKVHTMKHTGESPYPCAYPNCGRRFKSQRALDTHINKTHVQ